MTKKEREYYQIKWKDADQAARKAWAVYKNKPTKANKKMAATAYNFADSLIEKIVGAKI
jgi:hypothetical protein